MVPYQINQYSDESLRLFFYSTAYCMTLPDKILSQSFIAQMQGLFQGVEKERSRVPHPHRCHGVVEEFLRRLFGGSH